MHQILFRLGLCSRPDHDGELTALPKPLAGFKGPTSNGREERGVKGKGGEGREKEGRERKGRKCRVPPPTFV